MMNDLFFGQPLGTGMIKTALDETASVPSPGLTITVLNAANFKQDWGVRYASGANAGVPLTRVAASPATGQYTVNTATGVYTFASGDGNASVQISYTFTASSTGTQLNITNQLMGFAPTIQVLLETAYNVNQFSVLLYSVIASKLSFATKRKTSSSLSLTSRRSPTPRARSSTCTPTSSLPDTTNSKPGSPTGAVFACWG